MELNLKGLNQEQLDDLKEQIKKQEEENNKEFKIDYYEGYAIGIDTDYEIRVFMTSQLGDTEIDSYASIGLYRDTKEEGDKLLKKLLIHERLRRWSLKCRNKVDWNNTYQDKYFLCFDSMQKSSTQKRIDVGNVNYYQQQNVYFTDKSILEKAIKDIGEQTLINDYFVEV